MLQHRSKLWRQCLPTWMGRFHLPAANFNQTYVYGLCSAARLVQPEVAAVYCLLCSSIRPCGGAAGCPGAMAEGAWLGTSHSHSIFNSLSQRSHPRCSNARPPNSLSETRSTEH